MALAEFWGHWFDFNDATVSGISLEALEKQFAGSESAYMLLYRSRRLGSAGPPAAAAEEKAAADMPPVPPSPPLKRQPTTELATVADKPPAHWANVINKENEERRASRYEVRLTVLVRASCGGVGEHGDPDCALILPTTSERSCWQQRTG